MISKKYIYNVITIHARVMLLIANPSSRRRLHTIVKMAKCIFGDKLANKTFKLFTYVYCFGIFVRFHLVEIQGLNDDSVLTTKKCVNFFCVGVPMLTKEEYND